MEEKEFGYYLPNELARKGKEEEARTKR